MLRHVVLFKLKPSAGTDAIASLAEGLAVLPDAISEISDYRFGADLGLRSGNFDFGLVAEFADAAAFERYVEHPEHQAFIRERLAPVVAERVSLQYEI